MIRVETIKPRNEFSLTRLSGRQRLPDRVQLIGNFDFVPSTGSEVDDFPPSGDHDVLFYKLLRNPSDPPDGRDSADWVDSLGPDGYQERMNEIAKDVVEMCRKPSDTLINCTMRKEWRQYFNVIEFGGGIGQTLECLSDDGFHFKDLVSPDATSHPAGDSVPPFGVFLTGNFRGGNGRDPEESVLFVRIPYLGPKRVSPPGPQGVLEPQESWSLSEFMSQVTGLNETALEDDGITVHQAIFVVLNNAAIMVSKSKEDKGVRMVFPQQERVGAFHLLIHTISETLCGGDRSILAALESQMTILELQSLFLDDASSKEMASKTMGRITAMKALVAQQKEILDDLEDIFGRVVPDFKPQSVNSNKYAKNMLRVPVLSGSAGSMDDFTERTRGQMSYVSATLERIIKERRRFGETLQKAQAAMATKGQAQELKKELSEQAKAQATQAQELNKTLLEQAKVQEQLAQEQQVQAQSLQEEIEMQGKTLSAFTIVNVLFLPLAFFTQYFSAGNGSERNGVIGNSLELFWAVTAPCTFIIGGIALYYVLKSKYEIRQLGRLFVDMLKLKGWKRPIRKADAIYQKNYLRKLPKYKVLAVPAGSGELLPGGIFYLKDPNLPPGAGGDEIPLHVEKTAYPDEFRFDEINGTLFRHEVDEHDYMYYAHVASPSVPPGGGILSLSWKRSRMVMEKEPYRFEGAFRAAGGDDIERFLYWRFCNKAGKGCRRPRWDTGGILHASNFDIDDRDLKISVRARGFGYGALYRLKLVQVAT